jgi:hypothetical protein
LWPWRKGQFRAGGKEMFEVDKGRFPVRQCALYKKYVDEGGLSVENIRSGSFSSPVPTDAKTVFD